MTKPDSDGQASQPDDEVSIIQPPNPLAGKVKKASGSVDDLLAKAETMLSSMKDDFEIIADQLIAQLARDFARWQNAATRPQAVTAFKAATNALKGKSGSFGFGILGEVADLFRDYLTDVPAAQQTPEAIQNYINTLTIVWKQRIPGDGGDLGRQIVADLARLNERAIKEGAP